MNFNSSLPNIFWQEKEHTANVADISTINKWIKQNYNTSKWTITTSSVERKNKGKAPTHGYSHDKRLLARQPFVMYEGASSGVKPSRSTPFKNLSRQR